MKRTFALGLALLLPFAITFMIVVWIVDFLTSPFLEMAKRILSSVPDLSLFFAENPLLFSIFCKILIIAFLLAFTWILGLLASKYFLTSLLKSIRTLVLKIPFVRVIYKLSDEMTSSAIGTDGSLFQETVLIPFPGKDSRALGLVTKTIPLAAKNKDEELEIGVFVPTSPHPISGFILLTPKKGVTPIDLSTEEVFKYLISCGSNESPNPFCSSKNGKKDTFEPI